jgi:hypothetical protein
MTQARFEVIDVETGETVSTLSQQEWHMMLAASDLLEAAELVVARWERGDLAEAVRGLDAAVEQAKEAAL